MKQTIKKKNQHIVNVILKEHRDLNKANKCINGIVNDDILLAEHLKDTNVGFN